MMEPLPTEPEILLQRTTALLKQTLGTKAEITNYTIVMHKHDYVVMLAKVRHPSLDLLLKLAGPDALIACPFEQTAALHRLVATQTTIAMPQILAADSSYRTWPWRYLIRPAVAGEEWATVRAHLRAEEIADAHHQIGDAVAQLHAISFPEFGEFTPDGQVRKGKPYLRALRQRAESTIASEKLCALFLSLLDSNADLFVDVGEAALCHEDLHGHNLLFLKERDRWELATILDFDKAWAGSPEIDLARMDFWDGMSSATFWQAYKARRVVSPLYEMRRPFYQLLWCFEYANLSARHLADTNRLCEKLGVPTIDSFAT